MAAAAAAIVVTAGRATGVVDSVVGGVDLRMVGFSDVFDVGVVAVLPVRIVRHDLHPSVRKGDRVLAFDVVPVAGLVLVEVSPFFEVFYRVAEGVRFGLQVKNKFANTFVAKCDDRVSHK